MGLGMLRGKRQVGLCTALSNISVIITVFQSRSPTFLLQGCLDLLGITVRVEIGEGSHRSKGAPPHRLQLINRESEKQKLQMNQNFQKTEGRLGINPDIGHGSFVKI